MDSIVVVLWKVPDCNPLKGPPYLAYSEHLAALLQLHRRARCACGFAVVVVAEAVAAFADGFLDFDEAAVVLGSER